GGDNRDVDGLKTGAAPSITDGAGKLVGDISGILIEENASVIDQRYAVGANTECQQGKSVAVNVRPVGRQIRNGNVQRAAGSALVQYIGSSRGMIRDDLREAIAGRRIVSIAGINGAGQDCAGREGGRGGGTG